MMMISARGRLARDPKPVNTHSGKPMTTATVAVSLALRTGGETVDGTQWLNLLAFGKVADLLLKHKQANMVSVSGNCQLTKYTTSDGTERENITVILDSLISARTTRPGGGKRKEEPSHNGPYPDNEPARYVNA